MNVSVIITTYNRPHYLEKAIVGYLNQTCLPDEIIVADDGSTEETALLLKEFGRDNNTKIHHVWHEDRGFRTSAIRNRAIAQTQSEYLIICDDDVIPSSRFIEDHINYAEQGRFIQGHRVLLGPAVSKEVTFQEMTGLKLIEFFLKGQASNISNAFHSPLPFIRVSRSLTGVRSCNMSLYKKDFMYVNGFNEDFEGWGKEDSELVERLYKSGLKRKDIKFRACCYHLHHEHYSRNHIERNIAILEKTKIERTFFCENGIDKYLV